MSTPANFTWDDVTPADLPYTLTYSDGATARMIYTVPAGKRWKLLSWGIWASKGPSPTTVRLYKEAACTNLIEHLETINAITASVYTGRGYGMTNNSGWSPEEMPAGATVEFVTTIAAGWYIATRIVYQEADA